MSEKTTGRSAAGSGTISLGDELAVNRLGFGAMRLTGDGIWGPPKDPTTAIAVLRRAVELGVNFIDTADSYGPNVSEELIAEALTPYPKDLVIATKGRMESPWTEPVDPRCQPRALARGGGRQPERLRLDRIDVYQLHIPDPVVPLAASIETMANLQAEGKIRLVALSNVTVEHIERARKIVPIVSVQNRYSFADREWDNVVDYCEANGIAFIPWFPLGAGRVAGKLLERMAKARQVKPIQIALAWLLKRSPITLPIPGTSSIAHLEENIQAASLQLSENDYLELTGISELAS